MFDKYILQRELLAAIWIDALVLSLCLDELKILIKINDISMNDNRFT